MARNPQPVFVNLINRGMKEGMAPWMRSSRAWYMSKTRKYSKAQTQKTITRDSSRRESDVQVGSMYFFRYDAKYKNELPYWDAFPLIFPFSAGPGYIMGINLHYLPPMLRAKLMDELYPLMTDASYSSSTRLNLSYGMLSSMSKYFKPCIKKYLYSHIKTQFYKVEPAEWEVAMFLPTADWQGAGSSKVYADSRRKF